MPKIGIVWFRQDLRLTDNPALYEAVKSNDKIIPVYIYDKESGAEFKIGGASKWWLHHSLKSLSKDIDLVIREGNPLTILKELIKETSASTIYFNRCYEPYSIRREKEIEKLDIEVHSFNGSLLFEPSEIKTGNGDYYKVFTPFWKACLRKMEIRKPLQRPININVHKVTSVSLDTLRLLPNNPNWAHGFETKWVCGEKAAMKVLDNFIKNSLANYADGRNYPAKKYVSEMSPRLHFGELSPNYIWASVNNAFGLNSKNQINIDKYLAELGWREFSYHLLFHFPQLPTHNFKKQFDKFQWQENSKHLKLWQRGLTGYPIVDAGMRELWHTGYMHNRVRMIAASFLIKDLLIDWRKGAEWFWDTLVDADLASNSASWQWVAGSGADAAPYYRIFNPTLQSIKFDEKGEYIRKWIPELSTLPDEFIHSPTDAPPMLLKQLNIILGKTYPFPIVNHTQARALALKYYKDL